VLGKLLKSTSPSRSSSHGSDIMGMTDDTHQSNGGGSNDGIKKLTILHYNDVYNIDSQGIFQRQRLILTDRY
jgi:hypothetical protein